MTITFYEASRIKRQRRTKAEMEDFFASLLGIVNEQAPMTVRQVFYQAEVRGLVEKEEAGYDKVQRALMTMRKEGTLCYDYIVDHTRWQRKPATFSGVDDLLESTAASYRKAIWVGLDKRVEIWCEKDALAGVIMPITDRYDVPLLVARGYSSASFAYSAAQSIAYHHQHGIGTHVFHLGDYDPSGQDAARDLESKLKEYSPDDSFVFEQVAVRPEQIVLWNLSTRPTKKSDTRSRNFSGESVELDAIPPDNLRALVTSVIESVLPDGWLDKILFAEREERRHLERMMGFINDHPWERKP